MTSVGEYAPGGVTAAPARALPPLAAAERLSVVRPLSVVRVATWLTLAGNLLRVPVFSAGSKEAPLLVNDLAVAAAVLLGLLACLQARTLRVNAIMVAAAGFCGVGLLSALLAGPRFGLSGFQVAFSLAYLARWVLYFGIYVVVVNAARSGDARPLSTTLERTVLAFAAFGIVQAIFLPGFAQLVYPEDASDLRWDRQGHRLVSTVLDPNFAGALVLMPLLLMIARLTYGERVRPWKLVLLLAAVLLTVSRSTILALAVGLLTILVARGANRRLLRMAGWGAALVLPALPALIQLAIGFNKFRIDGSALARAVSWLRALRVLGDNLVIGVGFNTYGFVQKFYGFDGGGRESFALDGGLLFVAVMTGLLGLALFLAMLWLAVRQCRRVWRDASLPAWDRGTALGVGACTLALLVHSVFVNSLLLPMLTQTLWLLWGIAWVVGHPSPDAAAERGPRLVTL